MTTQLNWAKSKAKSATRMAVQTSASLRGNPIAFNALVVFSILYYYRPEDFISPLGYIPMAKIAATIAFIPILALLGTSVKVPSAVKLLWLLLLQLVICIPFSIWPGGAYHAIVDRFSKCVVVFMVISMAVVTLRELRRLLWIQVSAIALVTFFSIALRHYDPDGRLDGIQNGILFNPNDLAINIAVSFPLALAFLLRGRGITKAVWAAALAVMAVGVFLTASRSGLLALILTIAVCVWEYGIKGKRRQFVIFTVIASIVGSGMALSSAHYRARVESIFLGNIEGSGDQNSREARKELLKKSILIAIENPVFGVGPGCFQLVDNGWRLAHNSYTELAAEGGFPALILFLLVIRAAFKNLGQIRKSARYRDDEECHIFTQALWAGLVAYLAGALFASTEYNLYPYYIVGYTCAMLRITEQTNNGREPGTKPETFSAITYDGILKPQPFRSR